MESAARSGALISGEGDLVNKVGKYSDIKSGARPKTFACYNCGAKVTGSIFKHKQNCPAKSHKYQKCQKSGDFASLCKSIPVKTVHTQNDGASNKDDDEKEEKDTYGIDIFRISSSKDLI